MDWKCNAPKEWCRGSVNWTRYRLLGISSHTRMSFNALGAQVQHFMFDMEMSERGLWFGSTVMEMSCVLHCKISTPTRLPSIISAKRVSRLVESLIQFEASMWSCISCSEGPLSCIRHQVAFGCPGRLDMISLSVNAGQKDLKKTFDPTEHSQTVYKTAPT